MQIIQYPIQPGDNLITGVPADGVPIDATYDSLSGLLVHVRRDEANMNSAIKSITIRVVINQNVALGDNDVPDFIRSVVAPNTLNFSGSSVYHVFWVN